VHLFPTHAKSATSFAGFGAELIELMLGRSGVLQQARDRSIRLEKIPPPSSQTRVDARFTRREMRLKRGFGSAIVELAGNLLTTCIGGLAHETWDEVRAPPARGRLEDRTLA